MSESHRITWSDEGRVIDLDPTVLDPYRARVMSLERGHEQMRIAYAAAHVVMTPSYEGVRHSATAPGKSEDIASHIDWDTTFAFRRHLASHGFGIAEAMDTAQRFDLGWTGAKRLIEGTAALNLAPGYVAGASSDHVDSVASRSDLIDAVSWQARFILDHDGIPVLLPMAWLVEHDCDEREYVDTYRSIASNVNGPLIVHWLGPMFAPNLDGYFPGDSFHRVMASDPETFVGAKLSLLDAHFEVRVRNELATRGQVILTGDDFDFASLIEGSGPPHRWDRFGHRDLAIGPFSHALLGILDGIAEPAGLALRLLDAGDNESYRAIMQPCEALSQVIFEHPTRSYKVGLAFLSWLNGHQNNAMLVNHAETERSKSHLWRVLELATKAGAITNPKTATTRANQFFVGRAADA